MIKKTPLAISLAYLLLSLLLLSCAPEEKIEYPQVYKFQAVQIDPLRFYQKKADGTLASIVPDARFVQAWETNPDAHGSLATV